MDENLKKEIKEKYFQAKDLIYELENPDPDMHWHPSLFSQYKKELEDIDDFFRHLTDA